MSDPILWPSNFPNPSETLSVRNNVSALRTQMETGLYRQRRRFTVDYSTLDIAWEFTETEFGIFSAFCQHKLKQCSAWFQINLPLGGTGMVPHIARFVGGTYDQQYVPVSHWTVKAQLEIQEVKRFNESTLDVYLQLGFTENELVSILDICNQTHYVIHTVLNAQLN